MEVERQTMESEDLIVGTHDEENGGDQAEHVAEKEADQNETPNTNSSINKDGEMGSTNSPPSDTTSDNKKRTLLEEQNDSVYGTISHDMADVLVDQIEDAIQTTVIDALPLLQNNQKAKELLMSTLRHKFVRNIDVLEAFCDHNILTLRKHPVARRKRIVEVVQLMKNIAADGVDGENMKHNSDSVDPIQAALNATALIPMDGFVPTTMPVEETGVSTEGFKHPSKDDIPTAEQKADLDTDLESLQKKLAEAKERRDRLIVKTASISQADIITTQASDAALDPHPTRFRQSKSLCSEFVSQGQTIGDLTAEAERTLERLETLKQKRPYKQQNDDIVFSQRSNDEENTTDDFDPLSSQDGAASRPPKKRLSLEEAYLRDKKQLGLQDATNTGLSATLELLKPRARSTVGPNVSNQMVSS